MASASLFCDETCTMKPPATDDSAGGLTFAGAEAVRIGALADGVFEVPCAAGAVAARDDGVCTAADRAFSESSAEG